MRLDAPLKAFDEMINLGLERMVRDVAGIGLEVRQFDPLLCLGNLWDQRRLSNTVPRSLKMRMGNRYGMMQSKFTDTLLRTPLSNLTNATSSPSYSMAGTPLTQALLKGLNSVVWPLR